MTIGVGLATAQGDAARRTDMPRAVVGGADGVLRYQDNGEEAAFFGVNYVSPHAYTYRALGYVGADRAKTIHDDLLHLSRLGLNALRIHVWDAEISDAEGNLTPNDHLRLLDYLVAECRRRGLYVLLTPINWLGVGYPEADVPTAGFSYHFPKREMGTNPAAIAAEARFLSQLAGHVNAFTKVAYKDDPTIAAIELTNEPWSPPADQLKGYIETLTATVRATGCRKPIFYCASQGAYPKQTDAIAASNVEGATFGWYPSGLVSGRTLSGNFLPAVDDYPLMKDPAFARKAKAVYEFDGADLGGASLYPAFARTFRTNGVQWATQFAYCPLPLAPGNTPYQTHYLNLVYAPAQAMSLMIAGEAFRHLPRGVSYGHYPENTHFGPFRVSYDHDRSEMVTDTALLYANGTDTPPPKPASLTRVAGCGSSPVVRYEGTGCYFLERRGAGAWRLEVYPDAVWVDDPHGAPRLDREASRVIWREWPMTVRLPDLGPTFAVEPKDPGNPHHAVAKDGRFAVRPGVYLLRRPGAAAVTVPTPEFVAPPASDLPPVVVHRPAVEAAAGEPLRLTATVASARPPDTVTLHFRSAAARSYETRELHREYGYRYAVTLPADRLHTGPFTYFLTVREGDRTLAFPSRLPFPTPRAHVPLFSDDDGHNPRLTAGADAIEAPVSTPAAPVRDDGDALLVRARSLDAKNGSTLTVTLAMKDGSRCSSDVALTPEWDTRRAPLSALRPARGYLLRYRPTAWNVAAIALAVRPGGGDAEVASVAFGPAREVWTTEIRPHGAAPVLFDAARDFHDLLTLVPFGRGAGGVSLTNGEADRTALFVPAPAGSRRPAETAIRYVLDDRWAERRADFARYNTLHIRARAAGDATTSVVFALIDHDGTARGATLALTTTWQDIKIPLRSLAPVRVPRVPVAYPTALNEPTPSPAGDPDHASLAPLEALQFTLSAAHPDEATAAGPRGIEIESVSLAND